MRVSGVVIRRELRRDDVRAIVDLHDRVYRGEYGADEDWVHGVRTGIDRAVGRGWAREPSLGSVWIVEGDGQPAGSLALVLECPRSGRLDWFALAPELRGRGIGRGLVAAAIAEARARGMRRLTVETFSLLAAAGRIYRDAGFKISWEREIDWYGRRAVHERYELRIAGDEAA